jgi:5-methylcytosine-specific restriction endonuclease McrA
MARRDLAKTRARLWDAQKGLCAWCRQHVPRARATLDHVVPKSLGCSDRARNLVMACRRCNGQKGSQMLAVHFARADQAEIVAAQAALRRREAARSAETGRGWPDG